MARGDIMFWFDQEAIAQRRTPEPTGKRGAPWRYSDWSIQT
ncbi:transposase [uncultured Thiocystis sp.]|nr:transposase [uncultured Thiocystis sp.]